MKQLLRMVFVVVTTCMTWQLANAQSFREDFDSDVIASGSWSRSGGSVYVDVTNGWLHIAADGPYYYNDFADKYGTFQLPIVVKWRARLVSGGFNYTFPNLNLFWGPTDIESGVITYLPSSPPSLYGWHFLDAWTGVHTMGPTNENQWLTVRAIIRADGGELFAQRDEDTSFTSIVTKSWSIPSEIVRLRFSQPWDAVCDLDYIQVTTLDRNELFFPSVSLAPCDSGAALQPVKVSLSKPAKGGVVTFKVPSGVTFKGISAAGLTTSVWDVDTATHYLGTDSAYVIVYMTNTSGLRLPADTATLFNIQCASSRLCRLDKYIHWDTAQSAFPSRRTAFTDTLFATFYPDFDRNGDSTKVKGFEPGDVDNSGGVDISDLTCLVNFLYVSFTPCCLQSAADVTHDGGQDISDLTALVDYLYVSFAALQCPLSTTARPSASQLDNNFSVSSSLFDGRTIISLNAPREVKGIQLELFGPAGEQPTNLISNGIKMYSGRKDGVLHVGLIDPTGKQSVSPGNTPLLEFNGEWKILTATLADAEHRSITPQIGSVAVVTVPTEYTLSQNYPNPFNPATTISFALPQAGYAKLDILNALGQLVTTLIDHKLEAGTYTFTWDASGQASGVYVYRLTTVDFVETKKMLLLK
ncbi:MAG: T9SS type A sorting domain-containing protein [Ignavibacteriales bacterium]|nr:T9SS type A sorting domain-containing protein [Ignavibacteriales bacterium]